MTQNADDLRRRLSADVDRVDWRPLSAHAKRGGLILVDAALDLVDVAVAVASDDSASVQRWMEAQHLRRPTADQITDWATETEERFSVVIVQPYVLAQRDSGPAVE